MLLTDRYVLQDVVLFWSEVQDTGKERSRQKEEER